MFDGFTVKDIEVSGGVIHMRIGGSGPPLLLLHGYPQTHVMWHEIAPDLAQDFTVIAPDLRGYGDSAKPLGDDDHLNYSKREMAQDQVEIMAELGYERFSLAGHDRGGRVAHRLALDHPDRVERLAVLDIVPTHKLYANVTKEFATAYYHWFFLTQPFDFPERLIGADPQYFLQKLLDHWSGGDIDAIFSPDAVAEYVRCFCDPAAIHASCEDYRAAASIDLSHDEADLDIKLGCPVLVLWGKHGVMQRHCDVLDAWRERALDVSGASLDCAHFLAEEAPKETLAAFRDFF